jgi:hypothetical protein
MSSDAGFQSGFDPETLRLQNYRVYRKIIYIYIYIYEVASLPLVVTLRHWVREQKKLNTTVLDHGTRRI